ncbi:TetR/AcrR family transcriptional regulator C-terminal domain-containing protein (plasmid) [Paracoccus marcusii]|uniref:TetR/AcrR family transcriptional regulator C-terminal domain-containing protein n=1 Tax=Paracoccus marcusii TaxID=59779 RepID=UPI0018918823
MSKATLYSYFPEKSMMFRAALLAELSSAFGKCPFDKLRDGNAPDILPKILTSLADWAATGQRVRMVRIIIAEGVRFPDLVVVYENAFATRIIEPLKALIDIWIDQGQVDAHDSHHSARQLVAMIIGHVQQYAMLTSSGFTKGQLPACAQAAASLFLRGHTTKNRKSC